MKKIHTIIILIFIMLSVQLFAQQEIRVGSFNYYPAIFKDKDGSIKGFFVDALTEIGNKENIEFVYVYGSWVECLERMKNNEIDMMVSVAYTNEREEYMDFTTESVLTVWGEVYVSISSEIDGIMDLEGKRIAVMEGDINAFYLRELTRKFSIECDYVISEDSDDIFKKVSRAQVDAGVVNNTFGAAKYQVYDIMSSGILINPFDIYFTVGENRNVELLTILNTYLREWKSDKNSVFIQSRQKWSHGDVGKIKVIPVWLTSIIYISLGIIFVLVIFSVYLRYKIRGATKALVIAKENAEMSDNFKTAFLNNLSHEIRTPLNAILGFANMLKKTDLSDEKKISYISIINNSGKQLLAIVNDIVTISRLQTEQAIINLEKTDLHSLIEDLTTVFEKQMQDKVITLVCNSKFLNEKPIIKTDKTKLTQILTNLFSNALKFTQEGYIELGCNLHNDDILFYVKDTGIGINPDDQSIIFDRFRQVEHSGNTIYGGTGLGLSISRGFVELLGGKIWVESELGNGATFFFTIPYEPNGDQTHEYKVLEKKSNMTILLAEDEEYNYLFLKELLNDMNCSVIHAKDGIEAIEKLKMNSDINLILMDIKMPNLNGYEAAKIIKEFNPDIPIIAQTAYALKYEIDLYSDLFDDYLTKPVEKDKLIELLS